MAGKLRKVNVAERRFNDKIFDGLSKRNESTKKIVGRPKTRVVDLVSALKFRQSKEAYVKLGLRYAERIFGEKLKDQKYMKACIDHLATEYDLIVEHKMPEVVYRRGMSPFFVVEFRKELAKVLPKEFSQMENTIAQSILAGRYKDIHSAISRLKEIDKDAQSLPEKFEHLRGSVCYKVFIGTYASVSEAIKVLQKIYSDIAKLDEKDPIKIRRILSRVFNKGGSVFSVALEMSGKKVRWKRV